MAKKQREVPRGATPRVEKKSPRTWNVRLPAIRWQWLLLPFMAAALMSGMHWGYKSWPVTEVDVSGRMSVWNAEQIAGQLQWVTGESFFSLDVDKVHQQLKVLPLVLQVTVRKRWPGTLEVRLFEDVPVAVWNRTQLLSASGLLSNIPEGVVLSALTQMEGENDQAEQAVRYFRRIQQVLAGQPVRVDRLRVAATGAIQAVLSNGWQVEFGRQYFEERVLRLEKLLATLPQEKVAAIDLRYGKGAAIRWHHEQELG